MFHGGPLEGQRMMLPDPMPVFRAAAPPPTCFEDYESQLPLRPLRYTDYEREWLNHNQLEAALDHKIAVRYFAR